MNSENFNKTQLVFVQLLSENSKGENFLSIFSAYTKFIECQSHYDKDIQKANIEKETKQAELDVNHRINFDNLNFDLSKAINKNNID